TDHHRAGREADPDAEALRAPAAPHLARVLVHLGDDAKGAPHATFGVVLSGRRRAEEREYAVAREILDVPIEGLDLPDDPRHSLADHELHILGIEPLGERRRADDVSEERGQDLPLLACDHHTSVSSPSY